MNTRVRYAASLLVIVLGVAAAAQDSTVPKVEKGVRQLFFDDALIASMEGLTLSVHQPTKHPENPVLKRENPWEGFRVQVYGTVLYDPREEMFKAWYMNIPATAAQKITVNGQKRPGHATLLSYATSRDGVRWNKPTLNLVDFEGSKANNMIAPDLYNPEGFSCLYEPNEPDSERTYKAFYWDHGRGPLTMYEGQEIYGEGPDDGMHVAFSPDGVRWKPFEGNPVLKVSSDSGQCVLFDPRLKKYVVFSRLGLGRKVARSESDDFIHWSKPELVLAPDSQDGSHTEFYGISVDLYEGVYVGLLWMFWIEEGNVGRIDLQLCHSRDGKAWERDPNRRVFLPNGPTGAWDSGDMRAACRSVILPDRILIYYAGSAAPHGKGGQTRIGMDVGLATLRRDGWVSLDAAGVRPAVLLTKPFVHPGGDLRLNVEAGAAAGGVIAEFLDGQGNSFAEPLVSEPLSEDAIAAKPAFAKPIDLTGKTVCLRLTLGNAKLYSWWLG